MTSNQIYELWKDAKIVATDIAIIYQEAANLTSLPLTPLGPVIEQIKVDFNEGR